MTSKIAAVANLALHIFQQHSARTAAVVGSATRSSNCSAGKLTENQPSATTLCPDQTAPGSEAMPVPHELLQKLLSSVRSLTPKDVGFDIHWISDSNVYGAPVAYAHITENETFSMGIFILRPGSRIPLHDHPDMIGILRVIHGSVRCRSFTRLQNIKLTPSNYPNTIVSDFSTSRWQSSDLIVARPHQDTVLTLDSSPQVLWPDQGNLHELTPVDGPAVFLDILSPPYDHDLGTRECRFYKEVDLPNSVFSTLSSKETNGMISLTATDSCYSDHQHTLDPSFANNTSVGEIGNLTAQSSLIYLIETNQPKDYWCESAEYQGPSVV